MANVLSTLAGFLRDRTPASTGKKKGDAELKRIDRSGKSNTRVNQIPRPASAPLNQEAGNNEKMQVFREKVSMILEKEASLNRAAREKARLAEEAEAAARIEEVVETVEQDPILPANKTVKPHEIAALIKASVIEKALIAEQAAAATADSQAKEPADDIPPAAEKAAETGTLAETAIELSPEETAAAPLEETDSNQEEINNVLPEPIVPEEENTKSQVSEKEAADITIADYEISIPEELSHKEIIHKEIIHKEIAHQETADQETGDQETGDQETGDQETANPETFSRETSQPEISDQKLPLPQIPVQKTVDQQASSSNASQAEAVAEPEQNRSPIPSLTKEEFEQMTSNLDGRIADAEITINDSIYDCGQEMKELLNRISGKIDCQAVSIKGTAQRLADSSETEIKKLRAQLAELLDLDEKMGETIRDIQCEQLFLKTELADKIHAENVKTYRNLSDLFKQNEKSQQEIREFAHKARSVPKLTLVTLALSGVNALALITFIVLLVSGIL